MKRNKIFWLLAILFSLLLNTTWASVRFEKYFVDKTMRVDFFHTGIKNEEIVSLDKVYEEPALLTHQRQLWPGNKHNLIDTLNLGKYLVKVSDAATNQLIFSRGFCSLFGEWQTTDEAEKGIYRTFHESVLFPFPKKTVQLTIAARDADNFFQDIFSTVIDPNSRFVNRETRRYNFQTGALFKHGNPDQKVDLAILADGYQHNEMKLFQQDVKRLLDVLFDTQPFKTRKKDFNVWYVESLSLDSGVDEPRRNNWRQTVLGASYNSFDSPRYVLSFENRQIRDIASLVPYDQIY
ncbi:MAG: peptidase M64 N-terminal domain-containing protein, partial [bacterium]|nr:peptidase M64 N-terminal domain-containing protein [bacterium]